jgi:hypothetical protein
MHRNPVNRGLVASPELWRWSSFRAYFLGEAGPVRVNDWESKVSAVRRATSRKAREVAHPPAVESFTTPVPAYIPPRPGLR